MREEISRSHIGYSFRLAARVLLYASSHRQDNTYHSLCYTSRGTLAGTRNSSVGSLHEGSIRWPIAPWANALTTELHLALSMWWTTTNERPTMFCTVPGSGVGSSTSSNSWLLILILKQKQTSVLTSYAAASLIDKERKEGNCFI